MKNYYLVLLTAFVFTCLAPVGGYANGLNTEDSTEGKTFQTLLDKALFLKNSHAKYTAFKDNEINIVRVTTLDAVGEGSLMWAIGQDGPKIIVFEVGGVIDLDGRTLKVDKPFTYVAGQTAPNPGITIIKGQISVTTHDVIFEHIVARPGDRGLPKKAGWEADAFSASVAYNVLVNHCSFTWGTDENLSATGYVHLGPEKTSHCITYSNNLIAEGLNNSTHAKGIHSAGTLIHNNCRDIALVGNLFAHNWDRNPALKPEAVVYISNNLLYNVQIAIMSYWDTHEYAKHPETMMPAKASVIGNIMIPGVNTPEHRYMIHGSGGGTPADVKTFIVYNSDNKVIHGNNGVTNSRVEQVAEKPIDTDKYKPIKSSLVRDNVLKNVGSRPKYRDDVDKRIVQTVRDMNGHVIDSQEEVGGYPAYAPTTRALQVPSKNIEAWLGSMANKLINK